MPQVQDPFFHQGVVLLASHNEEGSLGFVVNRPTNLRIAEILEGLEIPWQGSDTETALLGGPVRPQLGTVLLPSKAVSTRDGGATLEIAPGISITQDLEILESLALAPPPGLRLVLGYAGWSPGQLDEEVERHDWLVCPVDADLIFGPTGSLWKASLDGLGIKPSDLPELSPTDENVN